MRTGYSPPPRFTGRTPIRPFNRGPVNRAATGAGMRPITRANTGRMRGRLR